MKLVSVRHPKSYFGFRKDKMFVKGTLENVLSLALGRFRFYLM